MTSKTDLNKLEKYANKNHFWDLVNNPEQFDLEQKAIDEKQYLEKLGLSKKNIEKIKEQATVLYEDLKEVEDDWFNYQNKTQAKIQELWSTTIEKLAANKVDYNEAVKEIQGSSTSDSEKKQALTYAERDYLEKDKKIRKEYHDDIAKLQEESTKKQIDDYKKIKEACQKENEEQLKIKTQAEKETNEIQIATKQLQTQTQTELAKLEAQAHNNKIGYINAEYQAKKENLEQEILLVKEKNRQKVDELEKEYEKEAKTEEAKQALKAETQAVIENGLYTEEVIKIDLHKNELARIEEVGQAWQSQFESRLQGLNKIASFLSKIFGNNSIFGKASNLISSYSSDISSIAGTLFKSQLMDSTNSTLLGGIGNLLGLGGSFSSTGTQQSKITNFLNGWDLSGSGAAGGV